MAGELSDTYENLSLDHLLRKANMTFPTSLYFGINRNGDPGEALGPGYDEPIGELGYARAQIVGNPTPEWNAASARAITNAGDSNTWANGGFPQLQTAITNATHWTLWTSPTGQTVADYVGRAAFPVPQTFPVDSIPIIEDGTFSLGWTVRGATNGMSTYACHKLCEHIVGRSEWNTAAEVRRAYLSSTDPILGAPTEPTAGGYARADAPPATWGNTASGANSNSGSNIQFPKATDNWLGGAVLGWGGLYDAISGGNELIAAPLDSPSAVLTNQRPDFAVNAWQFTID